MCSQDHRAHVKRPPFLYICQATEEHLPCLEIIVGEEQSFKRFVSDEPDKFEAAVLIRWTDNISHTKVAFLNSLGEMIL